MIYFKKNLVLSVLHHYLHLTVLPCGKPTALKVWIKAVEVFEKIVFATIVLTKDIAFDKS